MNRSALDLDREMFEVDVSPLEHEDFTDPRERYRFAKFPQHLLDYNKDQALEFQAGTFRKGDTSLLVGLHIYTNGLVADTLASTDDSDAFLEDLTGWAAHEYKLLMTPETVTRKFYVSHLDVETKASLSTIPGLDSLAAKIMMMAKTVDGKPRDFKPAGLSIWTDDAGQREAPIPFRFERKWGAAFAQNLYFSTAPLGTKEHISVLEELERLFTPKIQ